MQPLKMTNEMVESAWPRHKKTSQKTGTSEEFKKETIHGIQVNMFMYIYI